MTSPTFPAAVIRSPAIPRPSASLIVVNALNELLLVHRNPDARSFGGVHVFPGGNYDEKQDESLAMTAIRETFEESGLLITLSSSSHVPNESVLDDARKRIHSETLPFQTFLSEHQLKADASSLLAFTQWITPQNVLRRFRTQFFVAFLPDVSSAGFSSGDKKERIPTPDGGQEVVSARFLHPTNALSKFASGEIALFPPQFYLISTLCDILSGPENTEVQRERVASLSRGHFGSMVINPRMLPERDELGRNILAFEGDETRGGSKGRLHRVATRTKLGGKTFGDMALIRNFDIFTEIEPHAFPDMKGKL